jgi:hypothetical protein
LCGRGCDGLIDGPGCEPLDAVDGDETTDRREHVEGVMRAGELGVRDRLGRHRSEQSDEVARLLDGRERVERAVNDEAGWHPFAYVAHRGREVEGRELFVAHALHDVTLERASQRVSPTAETRAVGEVVDPVDRDECAYRRVDGFETGLESLVVRGEADHRGEVASGGASTDDDAVGVAAVLRDVLLHPRQRALAVDEMIGPRGARREAVVDGDTDPAVLRELVHERQPLLLLRSDHPRATVDLEQDRRGGRPLAGDRSSRAVDVETMTAVVVVVVREVADPLDTGTSRVREEHSRPGHCVRAVVVATGERLVERGVDHRAGSQRDGHDRRQADPRPAREHEPGDARPRAERTGRDEPRRRDDLPGEVEDGELGCQPGREEADAEEEHGPAEGPERVERESQPHDRGDEEPPACIHPGIVPARGGRMRKCSDFPASTPRSWPSRRHRLTCTC